MQEHQHELCWKTLEEGVQKLREVVVLEVLFGRGGQHDNDPNQDRCTGNMLWNLATRGPPQYTTFIATINPDTSLETVGSVTNKLKNYETSASHDRVTKYYRSENDMSDALEGTSTMYAKEGNNNHARGALPLARKRHGKTVSFGQCGFNGLVHQSQSCVEVAGKVIHDCEMCAAIKQAKRVKPLWYGGRWSKYKYGEAWQIDYITLPQTRQGKRYVLTMVEATIGWLETYPVPHATAWNTILGLERQVLQRRGTPERIESNDRTHLKNSLVNTWAREHGIEWVYHIPYHAPAAGEVEGSNGLLKTTLKPWGDGTLKNWEINLAKATWLVNTRGSTNRADPAQLQLLRRRDGDKVPVVHMRGMLGKTVWINSASSKDNPI
ncbi:hypothetical protein DUI87_34444 [Hirundo rustica rustica]|uniref:Integrase catalytic domain-containing protein n=1 Tax=Hirundo rustica rustica TaxID=333673 RepID=A0A3M0ILE1_HIRRU|nr:hypothetical protein DUI87_34444 [Hirundo rustica rustica]